MIRVAAITSGRNVPSSRFRVREHIPSLARLGFDVREHYPAIDKYAGLPVWPANRSVRWAPHFLPWQGLKLATRAPALIESWRSEITWIEREMLPGRYTLERLLRGRVALDIDDAIWLASPAAAHAARAIAGRADLVLAGNTFLAEWFSEFASEVRIVPTAVDSDRFRPAPQRADDALVIGWTGSSSTLPYLEAIEDPLRAVLRDLPRARLRVVANRPPSFRGMPKDRVEFIPWSESVEAEAVAGMDVGMMPLPDDDWSRGKCSLKMLQYMSAAVPVVVSPVGMNVEVLGRGEVGMAAATNQEWQDALRVLAGDREARRQLGAEGRRVVEESYSVEVVSKLIAAGFRDLLGDRNSDVVRPE